MCSQELLWRSGPIPLTSANCRCCCFFMHLTDLLSIVLRCNGFTRIQKLVDQISSRPSNSDHEHFLGASLALGSALELLISPTTEQVITGCPIGCTFHCMSQSDWEMVRCCYTRIREDNTSKWRFFWLAVTSWCTHLLSFFTFPICFKCQTTTEWLTLSSWAISCIVFRGSASIILSVGHCQLPMVSHYGPHLQGSHLLCKTSRTTTALCLLAVPGPHVLLMLQVVSAALWPILNSNKKTAQICFLSNSISIV